MNSYQSRYWNELVDLRVHAIYVELYLERSERSDKIVNVILAVTSSTSIATWAVWQQYGLIWAGLIATSQVITAIKMFLPYRTRMKHLSRLLPKFEELATYAEIKWYDVSEGLLSEKEIHDLQFEIRTKKEHALRDSLGTTTLPEKLALHTEAFKCANVYFQKYYHGGS